jgi:excisionase family DNA binding protein
VPRRPNPQRVKLHRSYSVDEAAKCLGVHKNTVRRWLKNGLPRIGGRGETLILGRELRAFLEEKRQRAKHPCSPGFMFCLKCRAPQIPAGQMIEYVRLRQASGNLKALCPECMTLMFRRIREADVHAFGAAMLRHAEAATAAINRSCSALPD